MANESAKRPSGVLHPVGNVCWCCNFSNPSYRKVCDFCRAQTTPTMDVDDGKLVYHMHSFGQRAESIGGCERLHASLLDLAVHHFQQNRLCAVQVGLEPGEEEKRNKYVAIMIKDAHGPVRSTIKTSNIQGCAPWMAAGDDVAAFQHAASLILLVASDPDKGASFITI